MTEKTIILPPNTNGNGSDAQYRLTMMVPKRRYFSYLRERWWVVLISAAVALGGTIVLETLKSPSYTSFAELYTAGEVQLGVASMFSEESGTYYGTQIELLKSGRLQNGALERMRYTPKPGEKLPTLEVVRPQGTSLLQVRATGTEATQTQRYLQALIDEYLAFKKQTRRSTSEDIVASLSEQVSAKEKDLKAEQEKLTEFQRSNNLTVLQEDSRSAGFYLSDLDLQMFKLRLDCSLLAEGQDPMSPGAAASVPASTNQMTGTGTNEAEQVEGDPSGMAKALADLQGNAQFGSVDSALRSAKLDLSILRAKHDQAVAQEKNGLAIHLEIEITNAEYLAASLEKQAQEERKATIEQIQRRIAAIEASLPVSKAKMQEVNERFAEGDRLKNNVFREQAYYDHLLGMLQNADLGMNVQPETVSVLQPPTTPSSAERSLPLRIVMGLVFGLAVGLGIVFVWYLFDDRFVSFHDIKDQFGETFLGLVPQIKLPKENPQAALLENGDARPMYVESYRHLRSALLLSDFGEGRPQTILFTSASPAEGKTTIAINLARLLARSGLRVVLVDADGQGGGMRRLLGNKEDAGVLDYLRGETPAKAIVYPTELESLSLVPGGTHEDRSEGLFLRPKLGELIQELRQHADFVILDGAPILASDAAALLVPYADMVVLVTRPFYTRSRLVRQALDMLYQRQAKHVSIILNRARADDLAGHYAMNGINRTHSNGTLAKP
jgi:capsular exopolysaccharide synthesis family protein